MINLTLYNFSKRVNSTKRPSGGLAVSALLKDDVSIWRPIFEFELENADTYNYLKWGTRYYYINDVTYVSNDRVLVTCTIDVLATFKEAIMSTTAYVEYSASSYDDSIVDTRFSTVDTASYEYSTANLITNASSAGSGGMYIITYNSSQPTIGATGCVWATQVTAQNIAKILSTTEFIDWLDNASKQLNGAYDALTSMKYVPITFMGGQGVANVVLAGYDTGISGIIPSYTQNYSVNLSIPWQFSDFRNLSPFTSLLLWLPAYGYAEINPADLIGQTSVTINLVVDGLSGEGTYTVGSIGRYTANFATDVPIGTTHTDLLSTISSIGGAVLGGLAGGGIGVALTGGSLINGVINANQRIVGNSGSLGSYSSAIVKPDFLSSWGHVGMVSICHDTNQEPTSLASVQGLNCRKVLNLGSLTGYVQTVNASVAANAPSDIINDINDYLNGGIYIE